LVLTSYLLIVFDIVHVKGGVVVVVVVVVEGDIGPAEVTTTTTYSVLPSCCSW